MDIPTKPTTCHKPIVGMEGGFKRGGNYKVAKPTKACLSSYNMGDAWVFWSVMEMCWQGKMIKIENCGPSNPSILQVVLVLSCKKTSTCLFVQTCEDFNC
jgi:hypothetical protein